MYEHLGKTALCTAFLQKVKDGIHIECYDKDGCFCNITKKPVETAAAMRGSQLIKDLEFEGDGVEKTLYALTLKNFVGVCVGEVVVPITELLYTDTICDSCWETKIVAKNINLTCECYIVYYANNRKRYVPKDYCEFLKGGEG